MKTTWVLTEDDKTKLGARRHLSGDMQDGEAQAINIKTEEAEEAVENVKQPQASPLSFNSGAGGNYYYAGPGGFSRHHQLSGSLYSGQTPEMSPCLVVFSVQCSMFSV